MGMESGDLIRGITYAMNEWDFIGQDILVGIGKSATSFKFEGVAVCETRG